MWRHLIAEWLGAAGFSVRQAGDGATALEMLKTRTPCLLITDMQMPTLDGAGLIAAVDREAENLPIIAMSGDVRKNSPFIPLHALSRSARRFLCKPFGRLELLATIDELAIRRRQHE